MDCCEDGNIDNVYREVKRLGGRIGEKVLGKDAESVLSSLTYHYSLRITHKGISVIFRLRRR